jgi:hypothetical protein
MHLLRKHSSRFCLLLFACMLFFTAGCGGDAYEKTFDESLQHLKNPPPPAPAAPADTNAAGDQQQPQQPQPQQAQPQPNPAAQ